MGVKEAIADRMDGSAPPELCAQRSFRETVLAVAARAKAALPDAAGRIDIAAALVLAGEVTLLEGGRAARVSSRTDGGTAYVVNGQCQCPEFSTAPGHFCTHRLAYGIAKRAMSLSQEAREPRNVFDVAAGEAAEEDHRPDLGHLLAPGYAAPLPEARDIPAHYLQTIDGKPFVKYAGLLAMAHERGLQQLEARFTRVSDTLAVAHATATFVDGRRFTESGDATPENVGHQVRPHFARLALTRAKARCLRDALNIGLCTVEELGG
jgi:hypothetical protein